MSNNKKKKLLLAYYMYKKQQKVSKKCKRPLWVHPILLERDIYGTFHTLFEELEEDEIKFVNFFRMKKETFQLLLTAIHDKIKHEDTNMRKSIPPAARLAVTLRYLASGNTFSDLQYSFRMGVKTISCIVQEVCEALWETLSPIYMKMPTEEGWLTIAKHFEMNAHFPFCLGAVDGKHIRIIKPQESGSMFYNYKHYFSIVLMAVVDANYNFIFIDVGAYGKECDSAVFKETDFWKNLVDDKLNIPRPNHLPGVDGELPYVFVADEAFALHQNLLRPYGGHQLEAIKRIFYYRLSRARRYVECAFGILSNKWRILHRSLNVSTDTAVKIVKTCCLLQNIINKVEGSFNNTTDNDSEQVMSTNSGLRNLPRSHSTRGNVTANVIRNKYAEYFMAPTGRVHWQDQYA